MLVVLWKVADYLFSALFFLMSPFSKGERLTQIGEIKLYIRGGTSDIYICKEIFSWKEYVEVPKGVVFDLGANIGAFSIFAAQTAQKVYAFEPESTNYAQLVKNIAVNTFSNITPIKKAVGGVSGSALLYRASANKGSSSIVSAVSSDTEKVEVITVEEAMKICGVDHIDLLKVDIEGSEYDLFEHISLETLERIQRIEMETHPVKGKRVKDIESKLLQAGFKVRVKMNRLSLFGLRLLFATRE